MHVGLLNKTKNANNMDFSDISGVIITIIVLIASAITGKKSKKYKPKESAQNPNLGIFLEEIKSSLNVEGSTVVETYDDFEEQTYEEEKTVKEVVVPTKESVNINKTVEVEPQAVELNEEENLDFDLKQAIIYDTILNLKHF